MRLQAAGLVILIGCGFLGLMMMGPVAHSATASTVGLRVVAPETPVLVGQSFDVEVAVDGATDLGAFEVDIAWNSGVVTLTGTTLLTFLGASESCDPMAVRCAVPLGPAYTGTDRARIGAYTYGTGAGATGSGGLVRLHFTALAGGTSPLTLSDPLLVDTGVNIITTTTSASSVTVVEATPTATPTPTETTTPTPTATPMASTPTATPSPTPTGEATPGGTRKLYIPLIRRDGVGGW